MHFSRSPRWNRLFNKRQRKFLLSLMATFLCVCGRANFTNLSRYSDLNEKTYRRNYAKSVPFTTIHRKLIEQCSSPQNERIAAVDCTFVPKSGKKTEGLDCFYNGSHSKSERGLEWSVLSIIDLNQNTAYTLNASQTKATKDETETRTQQYLKQVQENRQSLPSDIKYLVGDGYYSKKPWIDEIRKLKLHVIGKLRSDASLKYFYTGPQKARGRKRQYSGNVDLNNIDNPPNHSAGFKFVATVDEKIELYSTWVYSPAFKRTIQVVYLRKAISNGFLTALLFCTEQSCSALDVYRYYKARFQIEFIFRDSKQFLGLTHCQARDAQKLDFHFNAVLMTLNVLKADWFHHQVPVQSIKPFSVTNYKRRAFNQYLLQSFLSRSGLKQTCKKLEPHYLQCLELGLISS